MIITAAKASEAADILEVGLEDLTSKMLSDAYRSKSKECHPDHHGSDKLELWSRVSWAREVLTRYLKTRPVEAVPMPAQGDCRACGGSGRIPVKMSKLTMMCVMCRGSGSTITEKEELL